MESIATKRNPAAVLEEKREDILRIAKEYGATNVRVFGSVARGESDAESDLDLLVTFDDTMTLFRHAGLINELSDLMGCKVDVASDEGLKPRIRERVLNEAIPL